MPTLAASRDTRTAMAMAANTMPAPIRTSSCCTAYEGRWASQMRNATAPMIAAAAMPLTMASRQDRSGCTPGQAAAIRLKGLPAGLPADWFLSADTYRQGGRARDVGHFHHLER